MMPVRRVYALPVLFSGLEVQETLVIPLPTLRTAGPCCSTATTAPTSSQEKKGSESTILLCTKRWDYKTHESFLYVRHVSFLLLFVTTIRGEDTLFPSSSRRSRQWGKSMIASPSFKAFLSTMMRLIHWWVGPSPRSGGPMQPTQPW